MQTVIYKPTSNINGVFASFATMVKEKKTWIQKVGNCSNDEAYFNLI